MIRRGKQPSSPEKIKLLGLLPPGADHLRTLCLLDTVLGGLQQTATLATEQGHGGEVSLVAASSRIQGSICASELHPGDTGVLEHGGDPLLKKMAPQKKNEIGRVWEEGTHRSPSQTASSSPQSCQTRCRLSSPRCTDRQTSSRSHPRQVLAPFNPCPLWACAR